VLEAIPVRFAPGPFHRVLAGIRIMSDYTKFLLLDLGGALIPVKMSYCSIRLAAL